MAADWPCWRGPAGTGCVPAGAAVPASLPAQLHVLWQIKIGTGLSSPVVASGKVVYIDHQKGKEVVHAAACADGKEIWSAQLDEAHKDSQSPPGPRCTPIIDGDRVYAQSCRGELQCLDLADGKLRWRVNYVKDFGALYFGEKGAATGASRHGYSGSGVIDGDRIIVAAGGVKGASVVCMDKLTGKVIWQSGSDVPGYSGPVVATIAGVKQAVSFTAEAVIGLDAADGKLLWRVPVKTALGRHVTTPVVFEDMVVVSSHQAGLVAVRVTKADDGGLKAGQAWSSSDLAINFSSPVAVGGNLYGLGPSKKLFCADIRTGEPAWVKSEFYSGGKGHASFTVMGPNILVLTEDGQLTLIAADANRFTAISSAKACGANWCTPAYADGKLYLRDDSKLLCLDLLRQ
jgi:outer membrane protein assembly factor BamB